MATVLHSAPRFASNEGVKETLSKALGGMLLASKEEHGEIVLGVERERIADALKLLRDVHGYQQLMEMAGGTMDDIVRYVTYVTDRAYRFPMGKIFKSYFKMPPCGTGLIIDGLARPDMLVEIDCWAYIDDPD